MYIKSKRLFLFLSILFFTVGVLLIEYDLPSFISSSRAPWIDESLKNYITKNIIEFGAPQFYPENEFRESWLKSPIFVAWVLPFSRLFGIGYYQIRTLSLLSAIIASAVMYFLIKKDVSNFQLTLFLLQFLQ